MKAKKLDKKFKWQSIFNVVTWFAIGILVLTVIWLLSENRRLNERSNTLGEQIHKEMTDFRAEDQKDHREQVAYMRCLYLLATTKAIPSGDVNTCVRENLPPADDTNASTSSNGGALSGENNGSPSTATPSQPSTPTPPPVKPEPKTKEVCTVDLSGFIPGVKLNCHQEPA